MRRIYYVLYYNYHVCCFDWSHFFDAAFPKQAQERQNQLNAIAKGDEVVTIGGMYAVVDEVDNDNKKIVLDVDGVFLPFELTAIKRVVTKESQTVETDQTPEEATEIIETSKIEEKGSDSKETASTESAIEE